MDNILIIQDEPVIVLRHSENPGIPSVPVFILKNWLITDRMDLEQISGPRGD
jgi:hypothetical protein